MPSRKTTEELAEELLTPLTSWRTSPATSAETDDEPAEDEDDPDQTDPDLDDDPTDEVPTGTTSMVASHGRALAVGSGEIPLP